MRKSPTVFSKTFPIAPPSILKPETVQFVNSNTTLTQMGPANWEFLLISVLSTVEQILAKSAKPIILFRKIKSLAKFRDLEFSIKWPIVPIWFTRRKRIAEFAKMDFISKTGFVMSALPGKGVLFVIIGLLLCVLCARMVIIS